VNVCGSISHNAENWKEFKYASISEWTNKLWYIHAMEYYTVAKRNELLIHEIQVNLKSIVLS
jgi:hypothetical protein